MTNTPEKIPIAMWASSSVPMFSIAVGTAKQIATPLREPGQTAALVSVVFAAAALEAFLSEAAHLAELSTTAVEEPTVVATFAQIMEEVERARASIQSKFQFANLILTGKSYERGSAPYQNFALLVEARNQLMHFKSGEYFLSVDGKSTVVDTLGVVEKLRSLDILCEAPPGFRIEVGERALFFVPSKVSNKTVEGQKEATVGFTRLISTKATAEWACSAAAELVLDLLSKIPPSTWKDRMEHLFRPAFSAPVK